MTTLAGLSIYYFLLSVLDAYVTRRRVLKFGLGVEQNPAIVWMMRNIGVEAGIVISRFVPTAGVIGLANLFQWQTPLALMCGLATALALFQVSTLPHEDEIFEALRAAGQVDARRPPSPTDTKRPLLASVKTWLQDFYGLFRR